jgi:hypothetical protein
MTLKLLAIICLLWPALAASQGSLGALLSRSYDLAPRADRGVVNSMMLTVTHNHLEEDGAIFAERVNTIHFDQIYLGNADGALEYEIVIDSLQIGSKRRIGSRNTQRRSMTDYNGYAITMSYTRGFPLTDGCYNPQIELEDHMYYTASAEFVEMLARLRLIEQLRVNAGRRLSRIGDSVTIRVPAPLCYEVPKIIKSYALELQPFKLVFAGLSIDHGEPCAQIRVEARPSPFLLELASDPGKSITGEGTLAIYGEFLVAVDDGAIVSLDLTERMVGALNMAGESRQNLVNTTYELRRR